MSTSLRVVLNKSAAAVLASNTRVLLEVDGNGFLTLKPSERDDPNAISSAVSVSKTTGLGTFTINKRQLRRLVKRGGNIVAGMKLAVEVAKYRWLANAKLVDRGTLVDGPAITITQR